jgi:ribonuclease VapC
MIVVDSSALIAILFKEPEKQSFEAILAGADACVISAVNAHETACVLRRRHSLAMVEPLWRLLEENEIEIVPFDEIQVRAAAVAFDRYGKGIDPKAQLNLCDCAAYALAKTLDAPLLFKGADFPSTDVRAVTYREP